MFCAVLRAATRGFAAVEHHGWHHDFDRDHRLVGGRIWHQSHKANVVSHLKEESAMGIIGAIDVTSVTTALTDASTAIGTVGAAVLVVIVGVAAYKYIRRAL